MRLPLDWATSAFTPNTLLDASNPTEFGQLLAMIAEADVSLLEPADIGTLLGAFDVSRYLDTLRLPTPTMSREEAELLKGAEEVTVLALTTEQLLCSSRLRSLGLTFLTRIANTHFPTNMPLALEIVLTAAITEVPRISTPAQKCYPSNPFLSTSILLPAYSRPHPAAVPNLSHSHLLVQAGLPTEWHSFFDSLPFDQLSARHAAALVHAVNEALPLPPSYLPSTVVLLRRALTSSPHMPAEFAAELECGDDALPADGAGSLWSEVLGFFSAAISQACLRGSKPTTRRLFLDPP